MHSQYFGAVAEKFLSYKSG